MSRKRFVTRPSSPIHYIFSLKSLITRSFHSQIIGGFTPPTIDITSTNKMITGFSKSGDLISARKLFDEMPERDLVSWNSIMSAYVRNDRCDEALRIFAQMHVDGWNPNHTSFSIAVSSCGALIVGEQIHGLSIKARSSINVFVGTSLITMYSKCNAFGCLLRVFDDTYCPNCSSWNALISGFVLNRQIDDAREVFDRMPGRNVVSWTAMINGYVEVKKVSVALELFNSMPVKNPVSWSVMLGGLVWDERYEEAIEFFARMVSNGVQSTPSVVTQVIKAFSGMKDPRKCRIIHGYVVKLGYQLDQIIEASLVLMYCECVNMEEAKLQFEKMEGKFIGSSNCLIRGYINSNEISEARAIFDKMDKWDTISWNSIISGYLKGKRIDEAFKLFTRMPERTIETSTALMSSYIEIGRLDEAHKLFSMMPQGDVRACTTLIFGYMEVGAVEKAMDLFNKMTVLNAATYNVMISGLLRHGRVKEAHNLFNNFSGRDATSWDALVTGFVQNRLYYEAFQLYKKMLLSDIRPSELIVSSLLKASSILSLLIHGEQIHGVAIKYGHDSCLVVGNSLISMYCKCGNMLISESIFDHMDEDDVVTWNTMIYGYAFNGLGHKALEMFEKMMIKPNDVTFLGVLSACSHNCLVEEAEHYFNSMKCDYGIIPKVTHYACMVDLLCRMGMVDKAQCLVYSMPFEPDSVIWTSILSGCRLNCDVKSAEHAANELYTCHPMDPMPYLHLISIYKSVGRWADMEKVNSRINKRGSIKQSGRSWT